MEVVKVTSYTWFELLAEAGGLIFIVFHFFQVVMGYVGHFLFELKALQKFYLARTRQGIYNLKKSKKSTKQLLELNTFKVYGPEKEKFRQLQQIKYDYCQRIMLLAIKLVCRCFSQNRIYKMYKKGQHLLGRELDLVRIVKLLRFVKYLRKRADLTRFEKF